MIKMKLPRTLLLGLLLASSTTLLAESPSGYLVGQVTSVDAAQYTLEIDGRTTFRVPHTTRFSGDTGVTSLQDVQEGMWIRYSRPSPGRGPHYLENPTLFTTPQE